MATPNFALPYIAAGDADREEVINDNMTAIDAVLHRRFVLLTLALGETVSGTGARTGQITVPRNPSDGVSALTWNVRRIDVRLATAGTLSIQVEKSTAGTGAFSATNVGSAISLSAASEGSATSSLGTVGSGDKLRINVSAYTSGSGLTVQVLLESV